MTSPNSGDNNNSKSAETVGRPIRAKDDATRRLLEAARDGNLNFLLQHPDPASLPSATCASGCTMLHWAAGANQIAILEYLLGDQKDPHQQPIFDTVDCPIRHRKAQGRTPLHYSCRNGHLEATQWLLQRGADPHHKAKHGVTPFQLAVWQNHLSVCQYLVDECSVQPALHVNDFDCGAIHWLGIAPVERANYNSTRDIFYDDGRDLLPLAQWLAKQPGVDFSKLQRQGHSALHKASWAGHLALVQYLHVQFGMMDDRPDQAGNYAASLADMAQTPRHERVADYLRRECSVERRHSCAILGISWNATEAEIRKSYLSKAKECHPDKKNIDNDSIDGDGKFAQLHQAYRHLMEEHGRGTQRNPAHSLHLMLQVANNSSGEAKNENDNNGDDSSCFKARLLAVLLEYEDKGMDLSNIKKKWNQVWGVPFPEEYTSNQKKMSMSDVLLQRAADVIRLERDPDNGSVKVYCKQCSRASVLQTAQEGKPAAGQREN